MEKIWQSLRKYQFEIFGAVFPCIMGVLTWFLGHTWISVVAYFTIFLVVSALSFRYRLPSVQKWILRKRYPWADKKIHIGHLGLLEEMNIDYGITGQEKKTMRNDWNTAFHTITPRFRTEQDLMAAKLLVIAPSDPVSPIKIRKPRPPGTSVRIWGI